MWIKKTVGYVLLFFSISLIISIISRCILQVNVHREIALQKSLSEDGYVLINDTFDKGDIQWMNHKMKQKDHASLKSFLHQHPKMKQKMQQYIPSSPTEYEYQDYILLLNKSQIHTCHRDYNGDLYNKLKHPSFTFLIFLHEMNSCLDVIEKSHKSFRYAPYITDISKHILCEPGDILLFNSNLVHAGSIINKLENNPRIQMKICHKDDRHMLSYYENYYKIIDDENRTSKYRKHAIKHFLCQYPLLSDISINITNGKMFSPPSWYTRFVYGNEDFFSK